MFWILSSGQPSNYIPTGNFVALRTTGASGAAGGVASARSRSEILCRTSVPNRSPRAGASAGYHSRTRGAAFSSSAPTSSGRDTFTAIVVTPTAYGPCADCGATQGSNRQLITDIASNATLAVADQNRLCALRTSRLGVAATRSAAA